MYKRKRRQKENLIIDLRPKKPGRPRLGKQKRVIYTTSRDRIYKPRRVKRYRLGHNKKRSIEMYKSYLYDNDTYLTIGRYYNITRQAVEAHIKKMISKERLAVRNNERKFSHAIERRQMREKALEKKYGKDWRNVYTAIRSRHALWKARLVWGPFHDACVVCGTTEKKYYTKGMCALCFGRSRYQDPVQKEKHKKACKAWRENLVNHPRKLKRHLRKQKITHRRYLDRVKREKAEEEGRRLEARIKTLMVENNIK